MISNIKHILPFIIVFISVYIPQFGSYDIIGPQWFVLSLLVFGLFILNFNKISFSYFKSNLFIAYLVFIFLAGISLFYSTNYTLFLHDYSRVLIIFALIIVFTTYFLKSKVNFYHLSFFLSVLLLIESLYSLRPIISEVYFNGSKIFEATSINLMSLRGFTGNKNIAAASISLKSVFLFYVIIKSKKNLYKLLFSVVLFISTLSLFLLSARAALLSFTIVFFIFFVYLLFFIFFKKRFVYTINLFLMLTPFLIALFLSNLLLPNKEITVANRLSNIEFTNESSSYRLQLWDNSLDFISSHPFIGCGLGSWKVESSYYMRNIGADYLVPYHAHNDFLEITAELGLLGGLSYFMIFVIVALTLLKLFFNSNFKLHFFVIGSAFIVYVIDALLNFPIERPIMQIPFALIISYTLASIKFSQNEN